MFTGGNMEVFVAWAPCSGYWPLGEEEVGLEEVGHPTIQRHCMVNCLHKELAV